MIDMVTHDSLYSLSTEVSVAYPKATKACVPTSSYASKLSKICVQTCVNSGSLVRKEVWYRSATVGVVDINGILSSKKSEVSDQSDSSL